MPIAASCDVVNWMATAKWFVSYIASLVLVEEMSAEKASGGGKLESLSKEDLIKFAKRQTLQLNKAKAKIEGMFHELN